ncbi:hypothetical protein F4802DRAFT_121096 [Xylaria palmicola]|nr:hypothetical protein F4802DRAFT_121096 [Xylaria palmicola]
MKFFLTTTALAVGALAQQDLVRRDGGVLKAVLSSVTEAMNNVDNQVKEFKDSPAGLHKAGFVLLSVLGDGAEAAKKMVPLTLDDVVDIASVSFQSTEAGARLLTDLGAAAPAFAQHGFCEYAYNFTEHFSGVSNEFFKATKEKFPAESQDMATQEINTSNSLFDQVKCQLSPPACVNEVELGQGPGGEGEGGAPSGPPSFTTVSWHTGAGAPSEPTNAPGGGNGTHSDRPATPVVGSGSVFGVCGTLLAIPMAVALFL